MFNRCAGQGQEVIAEQAMDLAAREGHWVILQNVHLVAKWLSTLEKKIEQYATDSHEAYRYTRTEQETRRLYTECVMCKIPCVEKKKKKKKKKSVYYVHRDDVMQSPDDCHHFQLGLNSLLLCSVWSTRRVRCLICETLLCVSC